MTSCEPDDFVNDPVLNLFKHQYLGLFKTPQPPPDTRNRKPKRRLTRERSEDREEASRSELRLWGSVFLGSIVRTFRKFGRFRVRV